MSIHDKNIQDTTPDDVNFMTRLVEEAKENHVASQYIQHAEVMIGKMQGNIKARSIFQMLADYPPREYPEPEPVQPKKGARGAPPPKADPKAAPKKKKKTPPFPTPEWANNN